MFEFKHYFKGTPTTVFRTSSKQQAVCMARGYLNTFVQDDDCFHMLFVDGEPESITEFAATKNMVTEYQRFGKYNNKKKKLALIDNRHDIYR
jgi:hypothetical protein